MSVEWGEWINNAMPSNGMYIQVKAEDDLGKTHFHEGIVVDMGGDGFNMSPHYDIPGLELIEWRERKPKGLQLLQDILREVEDDGGIGYNERREREEVSQ